MTDIVIFESGNGGDISIKDGDVVTTDGLFNQPYLAHFGGNVGNSTTGQEIEGEERFDWWGNTFLEEQNQMNSLLENTLNNVSLNSSGRLVLENDSKKDLEFLSEIANVTSDVLIIGVDKLQIHDKLSQNKVDFFWNGTKNELIEERTI